MSRSITSPTTASTSTAAAGGSPLARRAEDPTITQKIGCAEVLTILENIRFLGYEVAMSRLVGAKPIIEIDKEVSETAARRGDTARRAGGIAVSRVAASSVTA